MDDSEGNINHGIHILFQSSFILRFYIEKDSEENVMKQLKNRVSLVIEIKLNELVTNDTYIVQLWRW